jgi:hypothetical protein
MMDVGLRNVHIELLESVEYTAPSQLRAAEQRHIDAAPAILLLNDATASA